MCRVLLTLILSALVTGAAGAQEPGKAEESELIQALLRRVEKLEKRLDEMEATPPRWLAASLTASPSPALEKPGSPAAVAGPPQAMPPGQLAAQPLDGPYPNLKIRGFTDINFSATDQRGALSGFRLGQFILHVASPLSQKISYFGEVSFTPPGFGLRVERSIIRYDYNDSFKISFGKYHTPITYWNTAFHHGLWLQTSVGRPEMTSLGGGFLPMHFVGLLAEGNLPSGGLGLGYNVGVGNGRGRAPAASGEAGDSNNNRAWLVNVFARPPRLNGLQVGGSFYRDRLSQVRGRNSREWIATAHVVWTKENPEFLAEFANVHHRDQRTGAVFNSPGLYVQLGYRLPWLQERLKPYYRFDYINATPFSESALGVPDLVGSTVGIRWDISDYAAFKGEYRNTRRRPGEPRVNGGFVQTSFTF